MDKITNSQLISIIAPLFLVQILLIVIALIALYKAEQTRGPKWLWVIIIVVGNLVGSIAFFLFGRRSS
ncbi:PLD nuclease N-terminal domain-containing protein [Paenibacillus sp. MMO-58]|uniref:PLD nuclease N-terminal domain-containing protein n=1 Tax=Paenibacillus sp. MMO-58 TaxID=3081290 RepID=UPI0030181450